MYVNHPTQCLAHVNPGLILVDVVAAVNAKEMPRKQICTAEKKPGFIVHKVLRVVYHLLKYRRCP